MNGNRKKHLPFLAILLFFSQISFSIPADETISTAVETLEMADSAMARSAAIAELTRQSIKHRLPDDVLRALLVTAKSDTYISVRLEATRLLTSMPMSETNKVALGETWSRELTTPDAKAWKNILRPISAAGVNIEIIKLLATLYEPPYPDVVIDAWIRGLRLFAVNEALPLLRNVRESDDFTDTQISKIKAIAERVSVKMRNAIYTLVDESLYENSLQQRIADFEYARNTSDRLFAGHALRQHFSDQKVPTMVTNIANRVMLNAKDKRLRGIAAMLIVHGEDKFLTREKMLMAGLTRHKYDREIMNAILKLYGEDGLQQFIVQYASNPRIPNTIKTHAVQALQEQASIDKRLIAETRTALIDTAWETSDYLLISAIESAFTTWHSDVPWIVYLK